MLRIDLVRNLPARGCEYLSSLTAPTSSLFLTQYEKTKIKSKKAKTAKKTTCWGGAGKSLKKLGSGIGGLSTTQKVAGGAAIVALGLSFLAKRRNNAQTADSAPDATAAEESLATMEDGL
jgi:hypothetical protein